jgi:hypothetical protein
VTELARMVDAPAWAAIRAWWLSQCVERAITSKDPMHTAQEAANTYSGGLALLLAIENEVSNRQGDIDGRTARHTGSKTEARPQGNGQRSGRSA